MVTVCVMPPTQVCVNSRVVTTLRVNIVRDVLTDTLDTLSMVVPVPSVTVMAREHSVTTEVETVSVQLKVLPVIIVRNVTLRIIILEIL